MLLRHFGLTEDPFGVTPDPKFLYFTREHREVAASIYYGIVEERGVGAIVARPGVGKTTLLHYLRQRIETIAEAVFVDCPFSTKDQLLRAVIVALGIKTPSTSALQNWRRFQNFLTEQEDRQRKVVVMFDEAQHLGPEALESICLLSNLETTKRKRLHIVLSGQTSLAEKLCASEMEPLAQRIQTLGRLHALGEHEVEAYIQHRLRTAGCEAQVFPPGAIQAIAGCSQGIPRNINAICHNTLALASLGVVVDKDLVMEVVSDLRLHTGDRGPAANPSVRTATPSMRPDRPVPVAPRGFDLTERDGRLNGANFGLAPNHTEAPHGDGALRGVMAAVAGFRFTGLGQPKRIQLTGD